MLTAAALAILTLVACGDDDPDETQPTAEELRDQTIEVLRGLTSVAFDVAHPNEPTDMGNGLTLSAVEGVALFPDRADMTAEGAFGRINVNFGIVQIGDTTYMRGPIGETWNPIDPSTLPFNFKGMNESVAVALEGAEDIETAPGEPLNGSETYTLTGNIVSDDLLGLVPGAEPGLPLDLKAWVRRSDGVPLRVVLTGAIIGEDPETMVRHLNLSEFNEPVSIEPPI